ncbi:delta-sarcoglycan-like [Trichoplusia ni]|uniref:Delta-sarcoglycan-like n=1 Tax=Trichoplusia ni TaxID=7111 RepID=A0A7E5X1M0_TRINI|nr:delta-sarcoglycan-like [Trichoplusia ni]XP_026747065.1 delta-sarcoglycan-like [Trichoplusia ni]XP_026747066.1 delta-sarcoglycan-like [Trichoplusia ni]XP_026747067.1 delta-sarcoglycan-like [Trichoplusia ni]
MSVEDSGSSARRGWGCTPTGEAPAGPAEGAQGCVPTIFTRGWRRNALYGILVLLMLLVFLNIALTLWIVGALKLSMNGVGPIRIVKGGIHVDGQAWVVDNLVASTITSQVAQPITVHSHRNFTVQVADPDHLGHSKLFIKRDHLEFSGRALHVRDARGGPVFSAAPEEVRVYSEALAIDGPGGVTVKSTVQVPAVRAPPAFDLTLESLTRRLDLRAPENIFLESRAGNIDITSHGNIKLDSVVGAIKLNAQNIVISNLKEAVRTEKANKSGKAKNVYQLCACASGKLFLAPPDVPCVSYDADDNTELCR